MMGVTLLRPGQRIIAPGVRVFQPGTAAASGWWLSGGISAANCIAAYAPKGAASLAASYTNLANPGTYNAAPGIAPTWDVTNGWIFTNSPYLTTSVVPVNDQSWSMIIRVSNTASAPDYACGMGHSAGGFRGFGIAPRYSDGKIYYDNGGEVGFTGGITSGVLAIAGNKPFRNGSAESGTIATAAGAFSGAIYIGAWNFNGSAANFLDGNIQALAIYNTTLTSGQVASLTTAMNAL
jgi:hypothetical protein